MQVKVVPQQFYLNKNLIMLHLKHMSILLKLMK